MRSIEDLVEGIGRRHDDLDAHAAAAEELGTAPMELVDIMRELRVPLVKVPDEIGGDQLAMADQLRYFEALSYSNPTAGWTGFNHAGAAGMSGAMLCADGIEAVFGSEAVPFFAAVSAPTGTFDFVDGGLELSGRYRFASGAPYAEWILLTGIEKADEPSARLCVLPADDVSLGGEWGRHGAEGHRQCRSDGRRGIRARPPLDRSLRRASSRRADVHRRLQGVRLRREPGLHARSVPAVHG